MSSRDGQAWMLFVSCLINREDIRQDAIGVILQDDIFELSSWKPASRCRNTSNPGCGSFLILIKLWVPKGPTQVSQPETFVRQNH